MQNIYVLFLVYCSMFKSSHLLYLKGSNLCTEKYNVTRYRNFTETYIQLSRLVYCCETITDKTTGQKRCIKSCFQTIRSSIKSRQILRPIILTFRRHVCCKGYRQVGYQCKSIKPLCSKKNCIHGKCTIFDTCKCYPGFAGTFCDRDKCRDSSLSWFLCGYMCMSTTTPCVCNECYDLIGSTCVHRHSCYVHGRCYQEKESGWNGCKRCKPEQSMISLSPSHFNYPCNDTDPCTVNDICQMNGSCQGRRYFCPGPCFKCDGRGGCQRDLNCKPDHYEINATSEPVSTSTIKSPVVFTTTTSLEEESSFRSISTNPLSTAKLTTSSKTTWTARPTLTARPISSETTSTARSTSSETTSTLRSTSSVTTSTARSTSSETTSTARSTSSETTSTARSTSSETISTGRSTSSETISTARPTSSETTLTARPTSSETISTARQISSETISTVRQISSETTLTAPPTSPSETTTTKTLTQTETFTASLAAGSTLRPLIPFFPIFIAETEVEIPKPTISCVDKRPGTYHMPDDCTKFYYCVDGHRYPFEQRCPPGTSYSIKTRNCGRHGGC